AHDRRVLDHGEVLREEERGTVIQTGKSAIYKATKLPLRREDGSIYALCGISVDITAHKEIEEALRESEQRFKLAGKVAYDLIYEWDVATNGLSWFGDIDGILGFEKGEISSNIEAWLDLIHPDDVDQLSDAVELHRHSTLPISYQYRMRQRDGKYRYWSDQALPLLDDAGKPYKWIGVCADVTVVKEQQNQLEHAAYHDRLTGLPNRGLLADRLHQAISQQQRREQILAVVYIDLDGFKEINDQFGHDVGDQLLVTIAHRFREVLREGDTIARLGGDEFVAVLIDLNDKTAALPMLNRIQREITQPISVDDKVLTVSASMGVTFCPQEDKVEADQLIRQADQAMYQAKMAGKNGYHLFDTEHENSLIGQRDIIQSVQKALQEQAFELYYQPKVDMHSGEILGAEALIRWNHPQCGLLSPVEFLPVVEDHPLAVELGNWVIRDALAQVNQWLDDGCCIPVSINISAQQMLTPDFVASLKAMLDVYPDLDHSLIELEILETSALQDITRVSQVMRQCEDMGISFALDDFGTGYSSLNYLKHLPAKTMKIDRSFVRDMLEDADDLAILDGVIGMSSAFRRHIIAEGVEDEKQGQILLQLGCTRAQGYAIARPMPARELPGWIDAWKPPASWSQQTRINRDDLSFLFAAVEHRAWVQAMRDYVHGNRPMPPELEHTDCRFGFWLQNSAVKDRIASDAMVQILNLHQQIHQHGKKLVALRASGSLPEIEKELNILYAVSAELQHCIHSSMG
ncbi:MAG: EAL domain-containing protein, partial [Amphritea sp.]|nr:EAL domain-containing protein [Amphritea sp.]